MSLRLINVNSVMIPLRVPAREIEAPGNSTSKWANEQIVNEEPSSKTSFNQIQITRHKKHTLFPVH